MTVQQFHRHPGPSNWSGSPPYITYNDDVCTYPGDAMMNKTGPNKNSQAANFQTFGGLPGHVEPPKPMTPEELEAPAPTPAQLKEQLRRILNHVLTPEKLQHLVYKMYDCARNGDKWAAQLLFDLVRGAKESDSHTPEAGTGPVLNKKQVEEELAKLGFVKPPVGLDIKEVK